MLSSSISAAPITYTLADHTGLFARIEALQASVDDVLTAFEQLVQSKDALCRELSKLTNKKLEGLLGWHYKGEKKERLVRGAYQRLLNEFVMVTAGSADSITVSVGVDAITNARRRLSALTPDVLAAYAEARRAARQAAIARRAELVGAVQDPKTLADFDLFVRVRGEHALTTDQLGRFDALRTDANRAARAAAEARRCASVASQAPGALEVIETTHTKHGHALFVVQLPERVERDTFETVRKAAEAQGGHYSSYRGPGAVPGFTFREREGAEAFRALLGGHLPTSASDGSAAPSARLEELAATLEATAGEVLGADRLTNTPRRARMAASVERQAYRDQARAQTLRHIARALAAGELRYLDQLRERVQLEALDNLLTRAHYAELQATCSGYVDMTAKLEEPPTADTIRHLAWPAFCADASELERVGSALRQESGTVRLVRKLGELERQARAADKRVPVELALVQECADKLTGIADVYLPWFWTEALTTLKRLARMEITSLSELRSACRELLTLRAAPAELDRAKQLERALVGQQVGVDFFPTPRSLAVRMVEMAGVREGSLALEPSAGNGTIAEAMRTRGAEVDTVELSHALCEVLEAKGFAPLHGDFLATTLEPTYTAIVMNPPFSADVEHVAHAYARLAEGGRLVAIVGEGAFFRQGERERAFRAWLDDVGADVDALPDDTFSDRRMLATTSARARLISVQKHAVQ